MPDEVIDVWMQQPNEIFMAQPWLEPLLRWTGMSLLAPPLSATLDAMDEAGVRMGLLSAWHSPSGVLISNDEVAAIVATHPDRFAGIAAVDLADPVRAVRDIRRCARDLGFVGVRVVPWLWNLPPNDRRYYPIFVTCVEEDVPFCTQIGHTGPLRPSEPGRPIPYLDEVLLDFPELVVVGGHVGYPWMAEVLSLASKYPNFHIDTSAYVVHRLPAELIEFMRGRGRTRVLFGSNYPMLGAGTCLKRLGELQLGPEARELYLGGNARRVFRLPI
ncbi:MAG TPA: amidohydrolase family protein [Amycolatopsis sp.]|uniref:amidohydrolase family protein n=1 Tax=Amycolatopsis sp. TaxID=37632 RepID=UPI002B484F77|nr:amidohydrolase family protein [Amycolatopsis sp.]HKS43508.1 amidohydrolase family protein [Amycolatopsis sp.]